MTAELAARLGHRFNQLFTLSPVLAFAIGAALLLLNSVCLFVVNEFPRWGILTMMLRRTCHTLAAAGAALLLAASWLMPAPAAAREVVHFAGYSPGTVVVKTSERRLYYVVGDGTAIRYPVGVGRAGMQWSGQSSIDGKYVRPAWAPTPDIKRAEPHLPDVIPGGSPHNPMGVAAMTLSGGQYAIHGTNAPGSIGGFVSHGCIRMFNADVLDLYGRVSVGTTVVVTR
jgi:lipoprotein-anchoring transpeptidase ErfK/SrfK